uniref:Uncharacterized protein n=1 Tax=Pararge aegeria TaxID=116150 RepID=S4PXZ1_9NEOP
MCLSVQQANNLRFLLFKLFSRTNGEMLQESPKATCCDSVARRHRNFWLRCRVCDARLKLYSHLILIHHRCKRATCMML